MHRFSDGGLQDISSCIIAALSLAALGLMIANVSRDVRGTATVAVGHLIALLAWVSSVSILALALWRHLRLSKVRRASSADRAVYAIVVLVLACLSLSLVWLSSVMLTFTPTTPGISGPESFASLNRKEALL